MITGEYPPARGGVADYCAVVASALAAQGDRVTVWAPACAGAERPVSGVTVKRIADVFGIASLIQIDRALAQSNAKILIQYVPHAFGMRAMNLPFVLWMWMRRKLDISIMFHEVAFPIVAGQPALHRVLAIVNRVMAAIAMRAARRAFVSTAAWYPILGQTPDEIGSARWIPLPSNIPVVHDRAAIIEFRRRMIPDSTLAVGHFGTFGEVISSMLDEIIPRVLESSRQVNAILIGRGSDLYRDSMGRRFPHLAERLHATGQVSERDASLAIGACDLMIQPFPDGITTRRTSAIVPLAHGRAIVTTSGELTEPLWAQSGAVAVAPANDLERCAAMAARLVADPAARDRMSASALELYDSRFAVARTIEALRSA
jgi:glycosyltransferase involved in cell wall biosynthesis